MKSFAKKIENLFAAVAFAEEGEVDAARQIMKENKKVGYPVSGRPKVVSVAIPATKA
ncbi:MAG: hypothetical protein HGA78_03085 [Nitrospirales bacterium]|nr:hypothetical protein [Nitrospirales bacterium]